MNKYVLKGVGLNTMTGLVLFKIKQILISPLNSNNCNLTVTYKI